MWEWNVGGGRESSNQEGQGKKKVHNSEVYPLFFSSYPLSSSFAGVQSLGICFGQPFAGNVLLSVVSFLSYWLIFFFFSSLRFFFVSLGTL